MGGQACVFYGAAQVSKDIDFVILASPQNLARLHEALGRLQAVRIAIPRFDPDILDRGHAVHFRCAAPGAEGLRVDLMTRLRGVDDFPRLWNRRTTFADEAGNEYNLLSIPDLVQAKKTQRAKDWPVIELLVSIHYRENAAAACPESIAFWMREARTAELLMQLCTRFPSEAAALQPQRPLLQMALSGEMDSLRAALDAEKRDEQAKDRAYWEPLKRELERFRHDERSS
jgi:hypothetical protein